MRRTLLAACVVLALVAPGCVQDADASMLVKAQNNTGGTVVVHLSVTQGTRQVFNATFNVAAGHTEVAGNLAAPKGTYVLTATATGSALAAPLSKTVTQDLNGSLPAWLVRVYADRLEFANAIV